MMSETDTMQIEEKVYDGKLAGKWLKGLIQSRGYTQEEIRQKVGVKGPWTVNRWVRGVYRVPLRRCRQLSEILGQPVELLVRVLHLRSQLPPL